MVKFKSIYDELGEERRQLQSEGKLPEWVTTPAYQMLKENYLSKEYPDLKSVYTRVASHAARYTSNQVLWENKFFNLLWNGYLAASTPVLSNMGTGIGCPVSCSGGFIEDSVYSFYGAQQEAAVLSKNGFGTSGYLGSIRPRGARIAGIKGAASGVLPVFKDFVQMSRDISQGSQRRGAWAGYIEIDHNDFYEIVNYINKNPDDANIGWNISDDFIARLEAGDKDAVERY
jgi:ribonucleoside-diphosphate reductase alpha chain